MPNRRFTCARLSHSYLTRSMPRLLTMTFTTAVFSRSSSWRFEAFPCRTAPKGPPSSLVQHDAFRVFLTQYLTFPALLLRDDISWTQIFDNTLEGRFPSHLPTHCEVQRFHFDPASRLLRQHDYTAEAFGSSAKAANVVLEHKIWDAIPFPYKRRVTPRAPDGTPRGGPTLIWIEIDDWSIR